MHSPIAPFRLTEREIRDWFMTATRPPSRSWTFHRLLQAMGRPIRAADLVAICVDFRHAWHSYRHLLRPMAAYMTPAPAVSRCEGWAAGAEASDNGHSSFWPAGVRESPADTPRRPVAEVEWTQTIYPDGRIVMEVPA